MEQVQIIEHQSQSVSFTPFDSKWIPCSAKFVVIGIHPRGTGAFQIYELEKGAIKLVSDIEKPQGIKCSTFGASSLEERSIATGDYDGQLSIWNLENLAQPTFSAHSSIVNCIDGCGGVIGGGAPEIVTGSRDGCVRIWDSRQSTAVASLEPSQGQAARDCWGVAFGNSFNDEERCVACGYDNGDIKLLDLRMNKLRWEVNVGDGITSLEFDRKDIMMNKLVVATLEARFVLYDMRTYHPEQGYANLSHKAHNSTIWLAKHLPQNREIFVTGGGDGSLHVNKYCYPVQRKLVDEKGVAMGVVGSVQSLNTKKVCELPVVAFDWSPDKIGLSVLASVDQHIKVCLVTNLNKF